MQTSGFFLAALRCIRGLKGRLPSPSAAASTLAFLFVLATCPAISVAQVEVRTAASPDLLLTGTLTGERHHQTYQELPFEVPPGVVALRVDFDYDRAQRTTLDLGLRDSSGFRGWSGGNKRSFTVQKSGSTPSYLDGPIVAGTWHLVLGVPNLRAETEATYRAAIYFTRGDDRRFGSSDLATQATGESSVASLATGAAAPANQEAGWYRGDLHLHSGHSDGSCELATGERGPCPLRRTLEVAQQRGLDFIALTEHNTTSHYSPLAALQEQFGNLLLIAGREITTFYGHANVYGTTRFLDFQLGSERLLTINDLLDQVHSAGALISINHPGLPSGELCMGCGWTAEDTPFDRFDAVEVINGGAMNSRANRLEGPLSGIPFWTEQLDQGLRLVAIGGSDNHDPDIAAGKASAVGRPVTVVYATALSEIAILEGIRSGRVFVDSGDVPGRRLDYSVSSGTETAMMGAALELDGVGAPLIIEVKVRHAEGLMVSIVGRGVTVKEPSSRAIESADAVVRFHAIRHSTSPNTTRDWLRVELRTAAGELVTLANPVHLLERP